MDYEKLWNSRYERVAGYRENTDPYIWIEQYAPYIVAVKERRALDLGCGDAVASAYLLKEGFDVTATDISGVALSIARERCPALKTLRLDMLNGIPFPDGAFGVVVAGLSTHYFSLEETRKIYGEILRVLSEDGILLIKVNALAERDNDKIDLVVRELEPDFYECAHSMRKRFFSEESLMALLVGFKPLVVKEAHEPYRSGNLKYSIEGVFARDS